MITFVWVVTDSYNGYIYGVRYTKESAEELASRCDFDVDITETGIEL